MLSRQSFLGYLPVIVSTVLLFGLAVRRHPSRLQWIALMVIFASAVVHFALFRFRLHYLSHAAFCLFVAGSPLLGRNHGPNGRTLAVQTLAVIALVGGLFWTSDALNAEIAGRSAALKTLRAESSERNRDVVERVLLRYR